MKKNSASIDQDEIDKFSAIAEEWWNPNGKFKPLHEINLVRLKYICDSIRAVFKDDLAIKNSSILDIGCGGGLLSEPLARLGAKVTAIDASSKNIAVAKLHAKQMLLDIDYRNTTIEEMLNSKQQWDVILNMEVVEHVRDVDSFVSSSAKLLKLGGIMFISTINKNIKSYLLAIVAAEYILRWLPVGTHDYRKFLRPSELNKYLSRNSLRIQEIKGISYDLFKRNWYISNDINVNYLILSRK